MKKWVGIGGMVILWIIATGYDLRISMALTVLPLDGLVKFGANFGAATAPLFGAYCFMMLAKLKENGLFYLLALCAIGAAGYLSIRPDLQVMPVLLFLLCCMSYAAGLIFLMRQTDLQKVDERQILRYIGFLLLTTIAVNGLKCIWGRPRFYTLQNPVEEFVPWYLPHPFAWFEDGLKSFPSGHTASACAALLLFDFQSMYRIRTKGRAVLCVGALLWIACIALSRICGGYHFLSDTLAGLTISYICRELLVTRYTSYQQIRQSGDCASEL